VEVFVPQIGAGEIVIDAFQVVLDNFFFDIFSEALFF
jgi:hypothetical protein